LKQPLNPPEPSSVPSLLLRGFLTLLLRGFQCSPDLKLGLNDKISYLFLFN
jgi:hypothetical protein